MDSLLYVLHLFIEAVWVVVIAHLIMSWLIQFDVLNIHQPLVRQAWAFINKLLSPIYTPLRRVIPNAGGLDFTPMVVLLGLYIIRNAMPY